MRKTLLSILLLVSSALFATAASDHDYFVSFDQLPAAAQEFVNTHFPKAQVVNCVRDAHSYEVRLADASEIEFNVNGAWEEVDCKYREVPASVVALLPKTVPAYVKANFPTATITKVNTKVWGFEIELNNGLEVEFNTAGQFLKIDD